MTGGVDVKEGGFTLVDLIVSLMILAVGILGLTAMVGVVGQQMRDSSVETRIAALARAEMERLLGADPIELESGSREQGDYRIAWNVTGDGVRQLRLVVSHQGAGPVRADTLATLVRGGP